MLINEYLTKTASDISTDNLGLTRINGSKIILNQMVIGNTKTILETSEEDRNKYTNMHATEFNSAN